MPSRPEAVKPSSPPVKHRFAWIHSLRFQLTASLVGIVALVLTIASLLLCAGARSTLQMQTDAFLHSEASRLARAAEGSPGDMPDQSDLQEAIASTAPGSATPRDALLLFDVTYARYGVRTKHDGKPDTLVLSPSLHREEALVESLDTLLSVQELPSTGSLAFAGPDEEHTMRALTVPIRIGNLPGFVQIAVPWDHNEDVLERLRALLLTGVPAVAILTAAGGWALVGRTLRPIRRIVEEAERLDAPTLPEALLPEATETDGEIGQLVATLNRMTGRLYRAFTAQRRFAEAQQRFAADASHELRTPLTILRGEMEVALSRPRSPETYRQTLESAVEEIDQMGRIVAGLGFLARQEAGRLGAWQTVDLTALSCAVVAERATDATAKNITLRVLLPETSRKEAEVQGDPDQLLQLVRNLVDNALKYTLPGGTIILYTSSARRDTFLQVEDTGVGIAPADLPHVFERFWRADPSRSSSGTGLGLAICARIAEAHGGELNAASTPGEGSRFTLRLPGIIEQGSQIVTD